ncbi:hypothetical protein E2C01_078575 [Portunus trituberculatus]|uniref:Uncharacterized protein n=1 Tax=Portunus trituberculatus TaxID=210409 RepID=A0A5B7IN69_PORTR|nr:hypothetical protein [Portunus trituberculatus]
MTRGSQVVRELRDGGIRQRGRMSAVTRFKLSVSHGKGRKAHQPSPASTWATPRSVLTCTASMPTPPLSTYCITLPALRPGHHNTRPAYPLGGLRRPPFLAPAVLRLTCAFLRKTGQLPRL